MGRELSMVRRLEKVEKEIGYCQIKLEKEQRLQVQLQFLQLHRASLEQSIAELTQGETADDAVGNRLAGVSLFEVHQRVSLGLDDPDQSLFEETFRRAGALPLLKDELHLVTRDLEDLEARLATFDAFRTKREWLHAERERALENLNVDLSDSMAEISREFEATEGNWNTLTEDLTNVEEAIRHVAHALDYLKSARSFILTARGQFNVETWLREGYLLDLFKHSSVGRAKEMVEGADRNLKVALSELLCLERIVIQPEDFQHLLMPFLGALFLDLFRYGRFQETMVILEARLERLERLYQELETMRDEVLREQGAHEEKRGRLFNEIGNERRRLSTV